MTSLALRAFRDGHRHPAGQRRSRSKVEFERHLSDARAACASDGTEPATADVRTRVVKESVIEHIEEFCAELQFYAFCDREILEESHVPGD